MVDSFGLYFITVGGDVAAVAGAVKTVKTSRARDYYYIIFAHLRLKLPSFVHKVSLKIKSKLRLFRDPNIIIIRRIILYSYRIRGIYYILPSSCHYF